MRKIIMIRAKRNKIETWKTTEKQQQKNLFVKMTTMDKPSVRLAMDQEKEKRERDNLNKTLNDWGAITGGFKGKCIAFWYHRNTKDNKRLLWTIIGWLRNNE